MVVTPKKWIDLCCRCVSILIIISFSIFIILGIYYPNLEVTLSVYRSLVTTTVDDIIQLNSYLVILAISTILLFIMMIKFLKNYAMRKVYIDILFYIEIVLFTIYLYYLNYIYHFHFVDDAKIILSNLESLLLTGTIQDNYLNFYHNNFPLALIYLSIIKLSGTINNDYLINCSIIIYSITILLMYHTLKQILSNKLICLILSQLLLLLVSVWLHVFNFYTDTLSLFFNLLTIFCLVKLLKSEQYHLKIVWAMLLGIAAALAMIIKLTLIILVIAMIVCLVIGLKKYNKLLILIIFFSMASILVSWKIVDQYFTNSYFQQEQKRVPVEHYLTMGIANDYLDAAHKQEGLSQAVGSWNFSDVKQSNDILFVQNKSVEDLKNVKRQLFEERMNKLIKNKQLGQFIVDKLTVSWGTGDLKTTKTFHDLTNNEQLKSLMSSKYLYAYMQYLQFVIYLAVIIVSIIQLLNKKMSFIVWVYQVFLIGCILFFIMWESSPRYMMMIYPMLPICIAVTLKKKGY